LPGSIAPPTVAKVSVLGSGIAAMPASPPRPSRRFCRAATFNIRAHHDLRNQISVLIDTAYTELAVRTLHTLYGLDQGLSDFDRQESCGRVCQIRNPWSVNDPWKDLPLAAAALAWRRRYSPVAGVCLAKQASIRYTA